MPNAHSVFIKIPKGMNAQSLAEILAGYLLVGSSAAGWSHGRPPFKKDHVSDDRWVLDVNNDYFMSAPEGADHVELSCRYSGQESIIEAMRALFVVRHGLKAEQEKIGEYDLVMLSTFLRVQDDNALRQLAHEMKCTRSDLVRAAVAAKLVEWKENPETLKRDLELGRVRK